MTKRHDGKCLGVSAIYGMLNASCGNDGLLSSFNEFETSLEPSSEFRRTAEKSVRSGWLAGLVSNYPSNNSVDLFKTEQEETDRHRDGERHAIISIDSDHPFRLKDEIGATLQEFGIADGDIQYSFNSAGLVFYYTFNAEFLSFRVRYKDNDLDVKFKRTQKTPGRRILGAHPLTGGSLVIEADDHVFLLSGDTWHTLLAQPAISVRTFPRSKRFQNMVTITTEQGIHLITAFDETKLATAF
jgi:hypothetical protein